MKKVITTMTLLMFIAMGCINAQQGQGKYMFTGTFNLTFSDQVKIKIGGAQQNKSSKDWKNGGKVGNHTVDAATFQKMQDATSDKFKIEIEAKKFGTVHKLRATNLETGKVVNGIYDSRKKTFTFGKINQTNQGGAKKLDGAIIKGKLDVETGVISDGKFDVGTMVGKGAVVLSAGATFTFTGALAKTK